MSVWTEVFIVLIGLIVVDHVLGRMAVGLGQVIEEHSSFGSATGCLFTWFNLVLFLALRFGVVWMVTTFILSLTGA